MVDKDIREKIEEIASKHKNLEVDSVDYSDGKVVLGLNLLGGPQTRELPPEVSVVSENVFDSPAHTVGTVTPTGAGVSYAATPSRLFLDPLTRSDLDLLKPTLANSKPQDIYQRSIDYWRDKDVYGTSINVLTNFAAKGFENDIDDPTIKNFYDNWVIDIQFDDLVEKIFFDFFRAGIVRTYKIEGRYEPKVNFLNSIPGEKAKKVTAQRRGRNRFTNSHIPIAYTILNPTMIEIKGSLMFGQTATFLKKEAGEELKKLMELPAKDLTEFQKNTIKNLPAAFKKAVKNGEDIPLDPELVGEVDYRRMPYERYPLPRGSRAFESVEFKDELRKADYSTLDGITNYILKITVGSDDHPIKNQEVLETVARLFDTVSKSFKVVWNHTLNVEKITSPEIGEVLGPEKYTQVNSDITAALGVVRALIDGVGEINGAAADLAIKSMIEEINYARRQVQRWIYREYQAVARAMKFDRFPRVRFDDMALRDELAMMAIIQGMIDRRIISYRTGQKKLGFDPNTEIAQMEEELPLVLDGKLGIIGSPFQQSRGGPQQNQRTPRGTPSEGRPRGRPAKTPEEPDDNQPPSAPRKDQVVDNAARAYLDSRLYKLARQRLQEASLDDLEDMLGEIIKAKKIEEAIKPTKKKAKPGKKKKGG